MKKFDFVAELLAHGFHDDTKPEAVELSRQADFEGVVLSRDFTKVIESACPAATNTPTVWRCS